MSHGQIPGGPRGMRPTGAPVYAHIVRPMRSVSPMGAAGGMGPGSPVMCRGHNGSVANMIPMNMPRPPSYPGPSAQMFSPGFQGPPSRSPPLPSNENGSQQESQNQFDHVVRVQMLVASLRDSLAYVVRVASQSIYQTTAVNDGLSASANDATPRLDKALEDFFGLCNQIEFSLDTIQECTIQTRTSQQYLAGPVQPCRSELYGHQEIPMPFGQLVATVEAQVEFVREIQQILSEHANQLQQ